MRAFTAVSSVISTEEKENNLPEQTPTRIECPTRCFIIKTDPSRLRMWIQERYMPSIHHQRKLKRKFVSYEP
jgi:hypothetical protein